MNDLDTTCCRKEQLDFSVVEKSALERYDGPFLLVDTEIIRKKYLRFVEVMPNIRPFYAMKANPDLKILKVLQNIGSGFEVASAAEVDLIKSIGVSASDIQYSNPVKSKNSVINALKKGVNWFAIDNKEELIKISSLDSDAKLCLRIDVPNIGSDWPLDEKFGATEADVEAIISSAHSTGSNIAGVTFHVGSQCRNEDNWRIAIKASRDLLIKLRAEGFEPELLNIGGGFPIELTEPSPSIEEIAKIVNKEIGSVPGFVDKVIAEPGRYLVSESGYFVCQVIGTTIRKGVRWVYLDSGMFGGLFEMSQGLSYPMETSKNGKLVRWRVAGPTCDSVDVLSGERLLPDNLREGDFVFIPNAIAYTSCYASKFNGFPFPEMRYV